MNTTITTTVHVVRFRDDLRVADHPALCAAMQNLSPDILTVAVYVLDELSEGIRPLGSAAKWWLHHGLKDLGGELAELGLPLVLRQGSTLNVIPGVVDKLCQHFSVLASELSIFRNRRYGGGEQAVDADVTTELRGWGSTVTSYSGTLLHEPWIVQTQEQRPFKVFTPFHNAAQHIPLHPELPRPAKVRQSILFDEPDGADLERLGPVSDGLDSLGAAAAGSGMVSGVGCGVDSRRRRHLTTITSAAVGTPKPHTSVGGTERFGCHGIRNS